MKINIYFAKQPILSWFSKGDWRIDIYFVLSFQLKKSIVKRAYAIWELIN